jgi:5-formyltetrahydrofolate cyclo-ligase
LNPQGESREDCKPGVNEADRTFSPDCKNVLILLPGLSFDREGRRIGYGKGYYDAFLAGLPNEADIFTAGACMKECMAENLPGLPEGKIPCEKHDKKADLVIVV